MSRSPEFSDVSVYTFSHVFTIPITDPIDYLLIIIIRLCASDIIGRQQEVLVLLFHRLNTICLFYWTVSYLYSTQNIRHRSWFWHRIDIFIICPSLYLGVRTWWTDQGTWNYISLSVCLPVCMFACMCVPFLVDPSPPLTSAASCVIFDLSTIKCQSFCEQLLEY